MIRQPEFYCVYGAGGHAHVVIDVLRSQGIGVQAVFDDCPEKRHPGHQGVRPGIRLAGSANFPSLDFPVILCVGRNAERAELVELLNARYGIARHPTAIVAASSTIGEGTVILMAPSSSPTPSSAAT